MKRKVIAFILTTTMLFTQSAPLLAGELESGQDNLLIEEEQFAEIAEEVDETVLFPEETDGELQEELTEVTDWGISEEIIEEIEGNDLPVAEELQPIEDEYYTAAPELVGDVAEPGAEDEKPVIVLDQDTTVTVADSSEIAYFSFVPSESGDYYFLSSSDYDTYGSVYDADLTEIASDDDSSLGQNFCLTVNLEADTQYYFGARLYKDGGGSFTVRLEKYFDNGLELDADKQYFYVQPGDSAEMAVQASRNKGSICYHWEDSNNELIEGATGNTYTAENIYDSTFYRCRVEDEYGNESSVLFEIYIENELNVTAKEQYIHVAPNNSATMEAEVSCNDDSGLTYDWYDNAGNEIEGAEGPVYTIENAQSSGEYSCQVTDRYGNIDIAIFDITVDNELTLQAKSTGITYIDPGKDVTMEVSASCYAGNISYEWHDADDNVIEGTNSPSFTAEDIQNSTKYCCYAFDDYGNSSQLWFFININNNFRAKAVPDSTVYVEPGGTAVMTVEASCKEGDISYQWYTDFGDIIEGATADSYSVEDVVESQNYYCSVSDKYGNSTRVWFEVKVDDGFAVELASNRTFIVTPGESVELAVKAECKYGNLTYEWYEQPAGGDSSIIEGATTDSYTVTNIEKSCDYICWVNSDYGNSWGCTFEITVRSEEIAPIQLDTDTQASVTNAGNIVFFSFTPEETDYYRFYSTGDYDTYGYLYDENFETLNTDDDEGEDMNFDLFYKMEAGTLYYCAAELVSKEETGSFTVRLEKKVLPDSGESSDGLFWHFEDGVLTISGTGSNWYEIQAGYNLYREDTTKIVIEEGVTNIGSYAFGDCENVREAELPNSLTSIGTYAFMGCSALTEITIPAGVTMIGDVAFSACSSLKTINFEGDAPSFTIGEGGYQSQFTGVTATATYPVDNDTWTDEVMLDYGGSITWTPTGFSEGSVAASDITLNANASEEQSAQIEVTENLSGGTLTYASDNENVTVDELGKVTVPANFAGAVTIWITSEAEGIYEEAETTITVTVNKIAGKVTAADITLEANMTESPTAQIEVTENLSGGELTYSSDNENVTVDAQGQITVAAGFMGTAAITINAAAGGIYEAAEAAITITVNELKPPITPEPQDPEPQEPEIVFTDVTDPETQPFYDYVYWAADNGITTGYEDGTFGPYKDCNRAATVTFIWRMAGEPEPSSTVAFDDMTGNEEFDKAILWAVENNITTGWSDNTFRPWNSCNRAAIVTFLWRYAGRPEPGTMAPFKDMTGNEEFDKAISWAWELGITTGYSDNTFRPWDSCNRLAAVSFLGRYDAM